MYKKFLGIMAVVFSMILSQAAFSESWGCGPGLKSMIQSLNLNESQKDKIKPLLDQQKASMKDLSTQMNDLDTQIETLLKATPVDQSAVDGLVDKKVQLIGSMIKLKLTTKAQIFAVLTAEQKSKLQQMMKKMEDKIAAKFKSCHQDD